MKNSEILNQIEKEEYFSALDWSIDHSDFELLDYMLKKHWDNQSFRKAISNSLLANVLSKAPNTDFIQQVLKNYVSSFDYKDVEGNEYVFHLMREETEDGK
ncbi:MAG: hypothetical protein SPL22_02425 [Treponema sp.]|uniref:hypothetical protein n=1 Tax=Treponema sp. TaxID=166 RepID=UPI002A913713|nr:hypothetical protein [Treponema sp.]MDY6396560.1 hypothetical protein [Treponema sp.]